MSTSNEQKMICNKIDGAPEQQDDNQPCSSGNIDAIDDLAEGMNSVTLSYNSTNISDVPKETCASCGKEGNSDDMNTCNKCQFVRYCNAACKKKHRSKHKKKCDRRVAELYDEELFKEVEREECPICLLPLPLDDHTTFESCCGRVMCDGCIYAMALSKGGKDLCAFCRIPPPSSHEENIKRYKKLMDKGNGNAFNQLAEYYYAEGTEGLPQDHQKANELFLKAGEYGYATGYYNLGNSYYNGDGVEVDEKKAINYWELAAMGGHIKARYNLGCLEEDAGNYHRAFKHYIISARAGDVKALNEVTSGFMNGYITKDEYEKTLRSYQARQDEMKSDMRDKAAASGMFSNTRVVTSVNT